MMQYLRLRLQETPLSDEHRLLFPALGHGTDDRKESLALIRAQLEEFDNSVASDSIVLQQKIEVAEKDLGRAMLAFHVATYALNEGTFELEESLELHSRLSNQYQEMLAFAIAEAMSPDPTHDSGSGQSSALPLWQQPSAVLEYINGRVMGCFERATRLATFAANEVKSGSTRELAEEAPPGQDEDEEKLRYLEILVPKLTADLRVIQRKLVDNRSEVDALTGRFYELQRTSQLAQVEVEEAQDFKDRLADQLLQIMLQSEKLKNARMKELFHDVDRAPSSAG